MVYFGSVKKLRSFIKVIDLEPTDIYNVMKFSMINQINKKNLKALSYIEVLVAMVIISVVFTAFMLMAYQAVRKAKILEQKGLMENYAAALLGKYGERIGNENEPNAWNPGVYKMVIQSSKVRLIAVPTCSLDEDTGLLSSDCGLVSDILNVGNSKFAYRLEAENDPTNNAVLKVTVTVACYQIGHNGSSCDGKVLTPTNLTRYFVNYAASQ